ncbi:Myb-like DNA-binding domain [Musa troglodytarum]|uniref:Myb-like DNA-binding domain n=1 Tax=Musa troglodytarum TaxID=320322 RepID=A0A9E7F747_9LILI|nr:Myb-like DNA-binding domain [Musa troglodytarum]URD88857.1 Myb-like DNA-binding domain [Musa troglodytarum]
MPGGQPLGFKTRKRNEWALEANGTDLVSTSATRFLVRTIARRVRNRPPPPTLKRLDPKRTKKRTPGDPIKQISPSLAHSRSEGGGSWWRSRPPASFRFAEAPASDRVCSIGEYMVFLC